MTVPTEVEFFTDPLAAGRITPRALLAPEGTVSGPFDAGLLERKNHVLICRLAGFGWYFNIGITQGRLVIQRPGAEVSVDAEWCRGRRLPPTVLYSWTLDSLRLTFGTHADHWDHPQVVAEAEPVPPPPGLIRWVREQEMTSVDEFASEEEFAVRVHSSLQRFEERLRPVLNRDFFWDLQRKGNRITARRPKRETDIQAALHAMLVDHMLLSNIDVQPEARSPAGSVDFQFTGSLRGGGRCRLCAEFKSAHSPDLVTGLAGQLRSYMDAAGTVHGAYCILDFRGPDFARPREETETLVGRLHAADAATPRGRRHPVKIHWLRLAGE
ncbi:MAG TPA: hypothetical protein VMB21_15245 [Candidatus Limnocylindria bacterium]|jgi:hypothetical protein|nr:hypothetical protein [Candidatus Limnocylindria bacterium]HTL67241.1 hypothetical protein [Lacunisphaera sp.]